MNKKEKLIDEIVETKAHLEEIREK